jgi:thiamine pyrophosphokinase
MRAAIIGSGPLRPTRLLRDLLGAADLVICADGGVRIARALGIVPRVVIGDFDSAGAALLSWARRRGARLIAHPREKDRTDTELAVEYALQAGAEELDLLGVLGARIDHTLANLGLLIHVAGQQKRARMLQGRVELFLAEAQTSIPGRRGDQVSLIPLSDSAGGVTTHGLKYPLDDAVLRITTTLGVSNEITTPPASVGVRRGWLLVVITHR